VDAQLLHDLNEVLAALARTPGKPGDLTSLLRHIAQTAQEAFATDACVTLAFNPITCGFIGSQAVVRNAQGKNEALDERPEPDEVAQQVLRDGVVLIKDLSKKPQYHNHFTHTEGMRAFAGLALCTRHRRRPLGVLYLNFRQVQEFSSTDYERFRIFAAEASLLLQETELVHNYDEVARLGQKINHSLATVDDLFQELQTFVDAVLDESHTILLAIYQPQTNTLDIHMRGQGNPFFANIPLQGACEHVIKTQESWFIRRLSIEARDLPFQIINITGTEEKESHIFVPLMFRDVSLGVLSIQHPLPNAYGQEDMFILQLLANYISLALHNMRLYSNLSQLNETGQLLTGQLESEQTLQATVDKIREATKADVVVLYPYEHISQSFMPPPHIAGTFLDSTSLQSMSSSRLEDIVAPMMRRVKPIFAKKSTTLYTEMHNNIHIRQLSFGQREKFLSTAAIPLWVGNESVGVLFVNFRQPQRFDATQKLFIEGLAHYAAIAIKNAQVFGKLSQRRVRELEILQNIDRELSRTLDMKSLLNTLLRLAYEQVPADEAGILLYNSRTQALEIPAAIGPHSEARKALIISLKEAKGITRWVLEHKKPARVDNVHRDPQWRELYIPAAADTISELDVPLIDGEEVIGVINFESTREGAFNQQDEDFLLTLAGQAVLAIKNAQAYEREKRFAEEGRVLNQISQEITSQLDPTHIFDLILEKALELTHSTLGSLHVYVTELKEVQMVAERGVAEDKKSKRQGLDEGIVGYVAGNKQLLNVNDVSLPPWDKIYVEFIPGTRSELAAPMLAGNELRGVLNVESPNPNNFSESDERLLKGLADLAVVALQNAERYEKAEKETQRFALLYRAGQELSKITSLTQIEQAYETILQIAEEQSQSLVVIRRYDEETQELVIMRTSQSEYALLYPRKHVSIGVNGQVARERRTIVLEDTDHPPSSIVSPKLSDPKACSLLITPIMFEEQYYGNLGLSHKNIGHFQDADILFFEGLAQQLASTIYRLETVQERQELKQRAISAEAMSDIGHMAFELTHRWDNDLGLVRSYVNDIRLELEKLSVTNPFIAKKLENIVQATHTVLALSKDLKQEFVRSGEAIAVEPITIQSKTVVGEPTLMHPRVLLEEVQNMLSLSSTFQLCLDIEGEVALVRGVHSLVTDILRNLVSNAIDAMPEGGQITLRARNASSFVALDVTDTGTGIPQQNLVKIFDLFYSTKGSSGFGLWSARRNALRNHGDLKVKSDIGQGTTFTLFLPRVDGVQTAI